MLMSSTFSAPANAACSEAGSSKSPARTTNPRSARFPRASGVRVTSVTSDGETFLATASAVSRPNLPDAPVITMLICAPKSLSRRVRSKTYWARSYSPRRGSPAAWRESPAAWKPRPPRVHSWRANVGHEALCHAIAMTRRLTWLGHATVLIGLGRAALLTDPVLRPRVAHLRRRVPTPQPPTRVDAALLSHMHRDHFDPRSLQLVDPAAPVVVPQGGAAALRRARREVHELAPGEALELAGARVHAVPAIHHGRRSPMSWLAGAVG